VATFVAASGASSTSTSGTVATTLPTGATTGDVCVLQIAQLGLGAEAITGWTSLRDTANNTAPTYQYTILYRVLQAGDTAPSYTSGGKSAWTMIAFRPTAGSGLTFGIAADADATDSTSGTTITPPALTTAATVTSVLLTGGRAVGTGATAITSTPPTNWTEPTNGDQSTATGTTTALRQIFAEVSYRLAQTGTITPGAITASASSNKSATHVLLSEVPVSVSGSETATVADAMGVSSLHDDFTVQDTGRWTGWDANTTISSGRLAINLTTGYPGATSAATFSLNGSEITAQMVPPPVGLGSRSTYFAFGPQAWNEVLFRVTGATLYADNRVESSADAPIGSGVTFDPVAHAYLRIRESGGTIHFEYGPNGSTWTELANCPTRAIYSDGRVLLSSGFWDAEAASTAYFDNVNVLPAAGATYSGSAALTGTGSLTAAGIPAAAGGVTLTGTGSLTGAGVPAPTGAPALTGAGSLTLAVVPRAAGPVTLAGTGALTLAVVPRPAGPVTLAGTGTLTAAGVPAPAATVPLTATGSLTTTGAPAVGGAVSLTGAGTLTLTAAPAVPSAFVRRVGATLYRYGQPFVFGTGMNLYYAAARTPFVVTRNLGDNNTKLATSLNTWSNATGGRGKVFRWWAYQNQATTSGARDWAAFDHVFAVAAALGWLVIPVLTDEYGDWGDGGTLKTVDWFTTGYKTTVGPNDTVTYRQWVAEVTARYRNDPTILAWEFGNELSPFADASFTLLDDATGLAVNKAWAKDIADVARANDPNHLLLNGLNYNNSGTKNYTTNYEEIIAYDGTDLFSYHDYAGDTANTTSGSEVTDLINLRDRAAAAGKPLILGEVGVHVSAGASRASDYDGKFTRYAVVPAGYSASPFVGGLPWVWNDSIDYNGSYSVIDDLYDIRPDVDAASVAVFTSRGSTLPAQPPITLTAAGALTVSAGAGYSGTAGLGGTGALTVGGVPATGGAAVDLTGTGTLTVGGAPSGVTVTDSAGLTDSLLHADILVTGSDDTGMGDSVSVSTTGVTGGAVTLTGTGTLTLTALVAVPGAVALSATGTLTAAAALRVTVTDPAGSTDSLGHADILVAGSDDAGLTDSVDVGPAPAGIGLHLRGGSGMRLRGMIRLRGGYTGPSAGTATLSATGALTTTASVAVSGSGALQATGALTISPTGLTAGGAVALSGAGLLATSAVPAPTGAAALSASAALTVAGAPRITAVAVAFTASAALTVVGGSGGAGAAALTALGSLTVVGGPATAGGVALTGAGSLTAAAAGITTGGGVALSAVGVLTLPTRTPAAPGAVGLTGSGALTLTAAGITAGGAATLAGTGSLAILGAGGAGLVPLTGSGTLGMGTPAITVSAGVTLAGVGTLGTSALVAVTGSAALASTGALVVSGVPTPVVTVALSAAGALAVAGLPGLAGPVTLTATGTLLAGRIVAVGLTATGALTLAFVPAPTGTPALTGTGTLAMSGLRPAVTGTVALAGAGLLTAAAVFITAPGAVTLSAAGVLGMAVAVVAVTGYAALTGAGQLVVTGQAFGQVLHRPYTGRTARSRAITPRPYTGRTDHL
jgi:hypothetical protein